jgi:hypothetical protein
VHVLPGETALAFYTATNKSETDIIGVATYSVTPAQMAPYFSKIQCFCFDEQRLNAGETVDMPVFFYLDPDLLRDINLKGVETVTLSYTFFSKTAFSRSTRQHLLTVFQRLSMTIMGNSDRPRRNFDVLDKLPRFMYNKGILGKLQPFQLLHSLSSQEPFDTSRLGKEI